MAEATQERRLLAVACTRGVRPWFLQGRRLRVFLFSCVLATDSDPDRPDRCIAPPWAPCPASSPLPSTCCNEVLQREPAKDLHLIIDELEQHATATHAVVNHPTLRSPTFCMDVTRRGDGVAAHSSHFAKGTVRLINVVLTRYDEQVSNPTVAMRVDEIHNTAIYLLLGRKFD